MKLRLAIAWDPVSTRASDFYCGHAVGKTSRFQGMVRKGVCVKLGTVAESSSASFGPCEHRDTNGLIWKGNPWPDQQKIRIFGVKFNWGTAKWGMELQQYTPTFYSFLNLFICLSWPPCLRKQNVVCFYAYLAIYKHLFLSSNNMHFRDMIQYLLKSREKFVLLSSLFETDPDQENKWYV